MFNKIPWPQNLDNVEELYSWAIYSLFESVENHSEGTVIVDQNADVVWINSRYAARFGSTSQNAIGRPVEEVIPGSQMRDVVHSGRPILLDIMETKGPPLVVMRLPIKNEEGDILGAIGFALYDGLNPFSPLVATFSRMKSELDSIKGVLVHERQAKYSFQNVIGQSPAILELKNKARRAAQRDVPILLTGETGTGKELLAHAIHGASPRAGGPLVCVNMGAIPESLMEAEFFGVAPGAYTGALKSGRMGKLELAEGGTLFLDEIGDIPLTMQGKLLRALQEKEYEPVGSNRMKKTNIRIIAATSADLPEMVARKTFRGDLYYRLNVFPLQIPPLRERAGCLPALTERILKDVATQFKTACHGLGQDALELLAGHSWPGNVRELRNILERAAMLAEGPILGADEIRPLLLPVGAPPSVPEQHTSGFPSDRIAGDYNEAMKNFETEFLRQALAEAQGSVPQAAMRLGLGRSTLYKKLKTFNILP
ncbi:MAG: sigma 54-interacting transcriptional regulator [Candidatus Adiutrix sp.]|jgi:transcriptional regulator with PAS, ATPase and Fis domain|nr:sigma 54-interacting transcriptional regulator [Candidatus Adiutrix sp.]